LLFHLRQTSRGIQEVDAQSSGAGRQQNRVKYRATMNIWIAGQDWVLSVVFDPFCVVTDEAEFDEFKQSAFVAVAGEKRLARLSIVYWRDIPAQVIVKAGRKSAKRELSLRFSEAIDMCAMKTGAAQSDEYLAEWRRGEPIEVSADLEAEAEKAFRAIESEYTKDRLVALVNQGGKRDKKG
jgi:hypothetical protein